MARRLLDVTGMECTGCETVIADELEVRAGVDAVDADHEAGTVELTGEADALADAPVVVERLGYEVVT